MNIKALNIFISDKKLLALAAAICSVVIFSAVCFFYTGGLREKNSRIESQLARLTAESNNIIRLKAAVSYKEKKARAKQSGAVSTLEQILKGIGIEARAIRPLGKKNINGFTEENTEVEIKGTSLNRAINLLYQIDTSSVPMKIKSASIQTAFEDPEKFILKLTVACISK